MPLLHKKHASDAIKVIKPCCRFYLLLKINPKFKISIFLGVLKSLHACVYRKNQLLQMLVSHVLQQNHIHLKE